MNRQGDQKSGLQSNETPVQPPVQRSWTDLPKRQALPSFDRAGKDPRSCKALLNHFVSERVDGRVEVIDCWTCIFAHPRFGKSSEPMSAWALQRSRHVVLLEGRRAANMLSLCRTSHRPPTGVPPQRYRAPVAHWLWLSRRHHASKFRLYGRLNVRVYSPAVAQSEDT